MDWLATYREYWEESYQRLDALLIELEAGGPDSGRPDTGGPDATGSDAAEGPR
jgi:hypothetical protein